ILAEGRRTSSGLVLPFQRGFKQIIRRCPVPIIPVNLAQRWGSLFSIYRGRLSRKRPDDLRYPAWILFGTPLPASTPAGEVRQAVQRLASENALRRSRDSQPVHRRFVRVACRHPFRPCIYDSSSKGPMLSYGKVLAGAMCLTR